MQETEQGFLAPLGFHRHHSLLHRGAPTCIGEWKSMYLEQLAFAILYMKGKIRIWEALRAMLGFFITGRLPFKSHGVVYRHRQRRLFRPVLACY